MNAIERAAEVIRRSRYESTYDVLTRAPHKVNTSDSRIARALADAGLLCSDTDRAVLDAADAFLDIYLAWPGKGRLDVTGLLAAVRARRETQP